MHTGGGVKMRLLPAPPDHGVVFSLEGKLIPATVDCIASGARNTSLSAEGATIHTVEHILAALYGAGVDNALVELSAEEPPAMDGSALPFASSILDAGTTEQDAERRHLAIAKSITVDSGDQHVTILPSESFRITYFLQYDHPLLRHQVFNCEVNVGSFCEQVAPARTFALLEEVKAIKEQGLAKGGSVENAVVFFRDSTSTPLRFPEEPARHKALDIIGDMSLLGRRLRGRIVAMKSGHALNQALARKIAEEYPG